MRFFTEQKKKTDGEKKMRPMNFTPQSFGTSASGKQRDFFLLRLKCEVKEESVTEANVCSAKVFHKPLAFALERKLRVGKKLFFILALMIGGTVWAGPAPFISDISPNSGPDAGGTSVTISGTNFQTGATVALGGQSATEVAVSSAKTSITAVTPAGTVGAADVKVTNPDGKSYTLTAGFTYTSGSGGGGGGGGGGDGIFKFLTTSLPRATRSSAYAYTLLTANAAGEITFGVSANESTMTTLNLTLDPKTGFISGIIPSGVGNASGDPVTFYADDGSTRIYFPTSISTTSAGGSDFGFATASLPEGEMEKDYSATIQVQGGSFTTDGLENIRFGACDLPTGLSLNGLTGVISGIPIVSGTFYVTLTATDKTKDTKSVLVLPLTVYPKNSTFKFDTVILDNGEVNAAYAYAVLVGGQDGSGGVTFSAVGLPAGLSIDVASGVISGTPTSAGTFMVVITAAKGNATISINRPLWIVPNGSQFYWEYAGQAAAFLNQAYSPAAPPLKLTTQNPGPSGATYSASGLPPGISFSAEGEFSGTPTEVGIYPVTYTAVNSASGEQITLTLDFIVLPPNGGDANSLPINLWVAKMAFKRGSPGKDSWRAQWFYNADRRTSGTPPPIFDAGTEPLVLSLGSIPEVNIPRTSLVGNRPKFTFKSAKGEAPTIAVKLDESTQTIALNDKGLTVADGYKIVLRNTVKLGTKAYRLDLYFDDKGKFTPALGLRKTAFVAAAAKIGVKAAGKDAAAFSLFLGDPAFVFPSAADDKTVLLRVYNASGAPVLEKDFTTIVTATSAKDRLTNAVIYKLKSGKDATAPFGKFAYDSKSGKMKITVKGLSLSGLLSAAEEHVSIELTVAGKQYFTAVTLFAPKSGLYSTKMP
jgi:hypothetical protein